MAPVAFFDVDETLITLKTMFSFLRFHLGLSRYERAAKVLTSLAAAGVPRAATNRLYYRNFAGESATDVAESGRQWFARELDTGRLFHTEVVRMFGRHRESGDVTALVSGSFSACLDPIAAHLGADHVLATEPEVIHGGYTGEVLRTVIGEGKADAARGLMTEVGTDEAACTAYGDHASDLPLLLAVGEAWVVGDDPVLLEHAARYGWTRLPATPALTSKAN
jgi:HAD superfamily hydrolase (TIGR01490 family)